MRVHFTRRSTLGREPGGHHAIPDGGYLGALDRAAVPEEMPFLIAADGSYDRVLNRFLRELPGAGCRSPETWKAYANDVMCLQRFLDEHLDGRHVLKADFPDLLAYHKARCQGDDPLCATSWNRGLAGLEKLFSWASANGLIEASPFRFTRSNGGSRFHGPSRVNTMHEAQDDVEDVKCITMDEYRVFRDVGLKGLDRVGGEDVPGCRARNRHRNLAIADFLLNTGCRITEAVSLLDAELPRAGSQGGAKLLTMRLAPHVAKGRRGRRIVVSERTLVRHVEPYRRDRESVLLEARDRTYPDLGDVTLVSHPRADRCRLLGGGELRYAKLDARRRRSLYLADAGGTPCEPMMLFLREDGRPTTADNIRAVFRRASLRCQRLGHATIDVHPHALRHTYAVCMLTQLIRVTLRQHRIGSPVEFHGLDPAKELFRSVTLDPVDHLRRLLGHRSVLTTYKYLTYVQDAQNAVFEAFRAWDDELGEPPPKPDWDVDE